METARPASEGDVAVLAGLWRAALSEAESVRGGRAMTSALSRGEPLERGLEIDLRAPSRLVVSGCIDGSVVGLAWCRLRHAVATHGTPTGLVELIYVENDARSVGVGEAMMDVVASWAAERGCDGIDAPALPGSRAAKAFFETYGMVTRLLVMHRRIDGPPPPPARSAG